MDLHEDGVPWRRALESSGPPRSADVAVVLHAHQVTDGLGG
jgi:hypothetical protein